MAQVTTALVPRRTTSFRLRAYVALTKPRIIELLLVTTLPTMVVAAKGVPRLWLMVATLVGGALSAGGANAANMFVDRDIDAVMHRTRHRPIVTGAVTPTAAVVFSIVLEVLRSFCSGGPSISSRPFSPSQRLSSTSSSIRLA